MRMPLVFRVGLGSSLQVEIVLSEIEVFSIRIQIRSTLHVLDIKLVILLLDPILIRENIIGHGNLSMDQPI